MTEPPESKRHDRKHEGRNRDGPTLTEKAKAEKAAREARLAQALRDNLRRRRRPGAGGAEEEPANEGESKREDKR